MKKYILYFYSGSINEDDEIIKIAEKKDYELHCFENIQQNDYLNIELPYIVSQISKEEERNIYIISDINKMIIELFLKHSWDYTAFILSNCKSEVNEYTINDFNCKYNSNFYSREKINIGLETNIMKNIFEFHFQKSKLINFLASVKEIVSTDYDNTINFEYVEMKAEELKKLIQPLSTEEKEDIRAYIISSINGENKYYNVYILSFLVKVYKNKLDLCELIQNVISSNFNAYQKIFLLGQIQVAIFINSDMENDESTELLHELYLNIFNEFKEAIGEYDFISKENRNENLIFVITDQILSLTHGPTKTSLDRCYILKKFMKKDVVLINTADILSLKGAVPVHEIIGGNKIEEHTKIDSLTYKDIKVPFYQAGRQTPDIDEYAYILEMVKKYKPFYIVTIGAPVLAADLCSQIVPTVTVPLGNGIPESLGTFRATYSDYIKYEDDTIIENKFTFDFKPPTHNYTKNNFNIPEDKFIIAIVGGRLSQEIDDGLLEVLNYAALKGSFILFIGGYEIPYDKRVKYNYLNLNSINMGFQEDVLAILELVDIYVNPKRKGGGTSAVEAMYQSKPAISINYGDVAAVIGREFCVENFEEMKLAITKYKEDQEFYQLMSKKAKEVAYDLMDSKKYFMDLCNKVVNNANFK